MRRSLIAVIASVTIVAVAVLFFATRAPEDHNPTTAPPLPRSMAAIGDSITQAVAADQDALGAAPEHSWATGTDPEDVVSSHSERLTAAGALDGGFFNNSVPGAQMADAVAQAQTAVTQRAEYVVVLVGANDVCASDAASMTSVDAFEGSFEQVMSTLASGLPRASIFVVSIPNVYKLWEVAGDQLAAQTIWDAAGICRSVLSGTISDDERKLALARNEAFNEVLERVCLRYATCRYDRGAVFHHEFREEEVGPLDHFHPSLEGQANLAELSWNEGYWSGI